MANKIYLNSTFLYREDTLENWISSNPILEKGEPSIVRNGNNGEWLKIGDGVTRWNDLPWKKGPKGEMGPQGPRGEEGPKGEQGIRGVPGVYVGSGEMPDGYNIQIDPNGDEAFEVEQTFNPESANPQSGKAVAEALSTVAEKTWTLLHDITLTEAVDRITLDTNCKEVYVEGIFNMSEDNAGQPVSVFFQPKSGNRLTNGGVTISASALKLYMRGEISLAPNGRLKGLLNVDANSLGYTKYSVESTLSQNFANAEGNISGINIQLSNSPVQALMEIGSTIKVWGR